MTIQETGLIMDILSTAYPQFYAGARAPDPQKTMALWAEMFASDDVRQVAAAVKAAGENGGERRGDGHILRQTVAAGGVHGGKFRRRGDGLHRIPGGGGQYGRRQQAQRQSAGQQQGCDPLSHGYLSCVLGFTGGSR